MANPVYKVAEPFGCSFDSREAAIAYALQLYGEKAQCSFCQGIKYVGNFINVTRPGHHLMIRKCTHCSEMQSRYKYERPCPHCGGTILITKNGSKFLTLKDTVAILAEKEKKNGIRKQRRKR